MSNYGNMPLDFVYPPYDEEKLSPGHAWVWCNRCQKWEQFEAIDIENTIRKCNEADGVETWDITAKPGPRDPDLEVDEVF